MGNKYANILVQATDQKGMTQWLNDERVKAFILPPKQGCILVCDEDSEMFDAEAMWDLTMKLSASFACAAIGTMNFDDDILWYQIYNQGQLIDEYLYDPETAGGKRDPGSRDHARLICQAFGHEEKLEEAEEILSDQGEKGYFSQSDRHIALGKVLGWPTDTIQFQYSDFSEVIETGTTSSQTAKMVERKWLREFVESDHVSAWDLGMELRRLIRQKRIISAMVLYQQHTGCSLKEAKEQIRQLGGVFASTKK